MITEICFKNYKTLRDTCLALGPYNLVVGPNGSGKSTLLAGLQLVAEQRQYSSEMRSIGAAKEDGVAVQVDWGDPSSDESARVTCVVDSNGFYSVEYQDIRHRLLPDAISRLRSARVYALDEEAISTPISLRPNMQMEMNGGGLAGVLDRMRDESPERFEELSQEVARLVPEFDRILFETPAAGTRGSCCGRVKVNTRFAQRSCRRESSCR